jgi:hypothetical protein
VPFPLADFDALSKKIASLLAPEGFVPEQMERNGTFGSHSSDYANGAKVYRLVWDGKESWLFVEYCDNFQASHRSRWNDIAIYRTGSNPSARELTNLGAQVVEAVRAHLASYAG